MAARNVARHPVILDHTRVIDGEVRHLPVKILGHGIPASAEHVLDEVVSTNYCAPGVVHELFLYVTPIGEVALALGGGQRPDIQLADAHFAPDKLGFAAAAAKLTDGAIVFARITRPERARPLLLPEEPADDGDGDNDDYSDNEGFHCHISRVVVSSAVPASADAVSVAAVHLVSKQSRDFVNRRPPPRTLSRSGL
jgi:hypothetical protein